MNFERLSILCTNYLINKGVITQNDFEIYCYCFQSGFEMVSCFLVNLIIALYMNWLPEYLIFVFVFAFTRSFSGGLHFNTFGVCFLVSCAVINITILCSIKYPMHILSAWIVELVALILIWIASMKSKSKKRSNIYNKDRIIKIMVLVIVVSLFCTICNKYLYVGLIAYSMIVLLISLLLERIKIFFIN